MKRKLISLLVALTMLSAGAVPVMAENTITVGGEVLYSQDFEGTVEEEMTTAIGGTSFTVETIDGNKVLKVGSASTYGYNKFGVEYDNAVVKMDFKQTACAGSNGAYLGLGVRSVRQSGGSYNSNAGAYFDVIRYNTETGVYDGAAQQLRDRLMIATTKGAKYESFAKIDAISEEEIGVLNAEQIFTTNLKISERNTGDEFLRMQNTIEGSVVTSELKTNSGTILKKLSSTVTPYSAKGYTQLIAHSGDYIVDNIKVMKPVQIGSFTVASTTDRVVLGNETDFTIMSGDLKLQPDIARYDYDKTKVNIDFAKGTIAPLKEGTYTVAVYLDDINGNGSLSSSFSITGVKAEAVLEAVIENPNISLGESTAINVYYGGIDVTENATISGATYADGKITPSSSGLSEIEVSYQGQTVTVPVAVNNTNETVAELDSTPVFTENFEGDAATLKTTYGGKNNNFAVESVTCSSDNTTDNALKMTSGTLSTTVFGPSDLSDYVLEYDSLCTGATGSTVSFYGATMRANSVNGGYKIGVTPVMKKYNPENHKADGTGDYSRYVTIAYSSDSANAGSWFYPGFSESSLQESVSQGNGAKWIHHKNTIIGDVIKTELRWRTSSSASSAMKSYSTTITNLNTIAGKTGYAAGGTTFATHGNTTYFDNVKIYRINKYNDIKVNGTETDGVTSIAVAGIDAQNNEVALNGTIVATAYGDAAVNGTNYTSGNRIGYVAVTYQDAYGNAKSKVVKMGKVQSLDANEFTIVSAPALFDGNAEAVVELTSGTAVYASATLTRGALDGHGVGMYIALYDEETNKLETIHKVSAEATQRVGDKIELYEKFVLPEGAENMYARIYLWNSSLVPLTTEFFEI